MTKSRGIKRPDWVWNHSQIEILSTKYNTTNISELAKEIGCTLQQIKYKAHQMGLKKVPGSMLIGREISSEHKEKIRMSMVKASEEGRLSPPKEYVIQKMIEASRHPDVIAKRSARAAETMRGIPQRMDGLSAAAEHNARAKVWTIVSPQRIRYTFRNLTHFVRENPELFDPSDVVWRSYDGNKWCIALGGLRSLFRNKKQIMRWKGWTAVSVRKTPNEKVRGPL